MEIFNRIVTYVKTGSDKISSRGKKSSTKGRINCKSIVIKYQTALLNADQVIRSFMIRCLSYSAGLDINLAILEIKRTVCQVHEKGIGCGNLNVDGRIGNCQRPARVNGEPAIGENDGFIVIGNRRINNLVTMQNNIRMA